MGKLVLLPALPEHGFISGEENENSREGFSRNAERYVTITLGANALNLSAYLDRPSLSQYLIYCHLCNGGHGTWFLLAGNRTWSAGVDCKLCMVFVLFVFTRLQAEGGWQIPKEKEISPHKMLTCKGKACMVIWTARTESALAPGSCLLSFCRHLIGHSENRWWIRRDTGLLQQASLVMFLCLNANNNNFPIAFHVSSKSSCSTYVILHVCGDTRLESLKSRSHLYLGLFQIFELQMASSLCNSSQTDTT